MTEFLLVVLYIVFVAFIAAIFFVPFSINKMEQHLKRIAEALEKITKKGDSSWRD